MVSFWRFHQYWTPQNNTAIRGDSLIYKGINNDFVVLQPDEYVTSSIVRRSTQEECAQTHPYGSVYAGNCFDKNTESCSSMDEATCTSGIWTPNPQYAPPLPPLCKQLCQSMSNCKAVVVKKVHVQQDNTNATQPFHWCSLKSGDEGAHPEPGSTTYTKETRVQYAGTGQEDSGESL